MKTTASLVAEARVAETTTEALRSSKTNIRRGTIGTTGTATRIITEAVMDKGIITTKTTTNSATTETTRNRRRHLITPIVQGTLLINLVVTITSIRTIKKEGKTLKITMDIKGIMKGRTVKFLRVVRIRNTITNTTPTDQGTRNLTKSGLKVRMKCLTAPNPTPRSSNIFKRNLTNKIIHSNNKIQINRTTSISLLISQQNLIISPLIL